MLRRIHSQNEPAGEGGRLPSASRPLLHLNVTLDPVENEWKAGQFAKIKSDGLLLAGGSAARFANRLQALGYYIRRTKDAFEIAGIPDR